jgi:hypothetical protein
MPRRMPPIGSRFTRSVDEATAIFRVAEAVRATKAYPKVKSQITVPIVERLYELSFLRIFAAWENFIEDSLLHMLCGFDSVLYTPVYEHPYRRFPNISAAQAALFNGKPFVLWYDPATIQTRSAKYLTAAPQQTVAASNAARLLWFAYVRNRVAHDAEDARRKFDIASMGLSGRRYPRSRAGKLLRAADPATGTKFIESIAAEFKGLALQIAP